MGILGCAFASASDVPVPQETTNVSLGLNLSANATSESPAQVSVKFESVANTTNESSKPLLLVHGWYTGSTDEDEDEVDNSLRCPFDYPVCAKDNDAEGRYTEGDCL